MKTRATRHSAFLTAATAGTVRVPYEKSRAHEAELAGDGEEKRYYSPIPIPFLSPLRVVTVVLPTRTSGEVRPEERIRGAFAR